MIAKQYFYNCYKNQVKQLCSKVMPEFYLNQDLHDIGYLQKLYIKLL